MRAGWDAVYANLKTMVEEAFEKEKLAVYNSPGNPASN
jgi:hypothetical protein